MPRRPGTRPSTPPPLPTVHFSRDHDRSVVAARHRDGEWVRIRPGASVDAHELEGPDAARRRALARIVAVSRQLSQDAVISHTSAACLWGLPTRHAPTSTHVIQPGRPRRSARSDVTPHHHALAPDHVMELHGIRVTTLERTVVDCAMTESAPGGLVVVDAALHRGADAEACARILSRMVGRRGVVRARAVLAFADGGAESAGESLLRAALLSMGLPVPQTQVPVVTRLGTFWADLGWPEHRVVVEYDGRDKYTDAGALMAEKRREDAILESGWRLVRVTAADLQDPFALAGRVRRLLPRAPVEPRSILAL